MSDFFNVCISLKNKYCVIDVLLGLSRLFKLKVMNSAQQISYPKLWKQRRYVFLRFYLHKDIEEMIAFLIRLLSQSRYWSGEDKRNQWSYYNEVQWSYYNISSIAPTYPRFMLYKLSCFYLLSELLPQTLP